MKKIHFSIFFSIIIICLHFSVANAQANPPITGSELDCIQKSMNKYSQNPMNNFKFDGCCVRAQDFYDELMNDCPSLSGKIDQVWLEGHYLCPINNIIWQEHTCLRFFDAKGDSWVLDPAMFPNPTPWNTWVSACRAQGKTESYCSSCAQFKTPACAHGTGSIDPSALKKARCYYSCLGAMIKGVQNCKGASCEAGVMTKCESCTSACAAQGITIPGIIQEWIDFQSPGKTACQWAYRFKEPAGVTPQIAQISQCNTPSPSPSPVIPSIAKNKNLYSLNTTYIPSGITNEYGSGLMALFGMSLNLDDPNCPVPLDGESPTTPGATLTYTGLTDYMNWFAYVTQSLSSGFPSVPRQDCVSNSTTLFDKSSPGNASCYNDYNGMPNFCSYVNNKIQSCGNVCCDAAHKCVGGKCIKS